MTGWWRRNAVALGALVVLVFVTFGAIAWEGWQNYDLHRNSLPLDVPAEDSIEVLETTWGPIRGGQIADLTGLDVPAGSMVIAVAIPVEPHGEPPGCFPPSLVEQSTGVRWGQARSEIGLGYSATEPTGCLLTEDSETPYEMIVPFVVPSDAEGPFWVEVAPVGAEPSVIRFALER